VFSENRYTLFRIMRSSAARRPRRPGRVCQIACAVDAKPTTWVIMDVVALLIIVAVQLAHGLFSAG
jgi:hypothetical protein